MTPNEYQKLAMRTKGNTFTDKELMVNAALGLAGESTEYLESVADGNIDDNKKELGDIQWYVALMCDVCGFDFSALMELKFPLYGKVSTKQAMLPPVAGGICDHIKKMYFHGHDIPKDDLFKLLSYFQNIILDICDESGFDIKEIWQLNIDKLKKRYPDGFDSEKSIHREE